MAKSLSTNESGTLALVIGGMRCGTTFAFRTLAQHPALCASSRKELHFFSSKANWEMGEDWYLSQWPDFDAARHSARIEATTHYAKYPAHEDVVERMATLHFDYRFIYFVRNPVDRIESHYAFQLGKGYIRESDREKFLYARAMDYSRYHMQISRYLRQFNKGRFLVVMLEQVKDNPEQSFANICRFLGVDANFRFSFSLINARVHYLARARRERKQNYVALSNSERLSIAQQLKGDVAALTNEFSLDVRCWADFAELHNLVPSTSAVTS